MGLTPGVRTRSRTGCCASARRIGRCRRFRERRSGRRVHVVITVRGIQRRRSGVVQRVSRTDPDVNQGICLHPRKLPADVERLRYTLHVRVRLNIERSALHLVFETRIASELKDVLVRARYCREAYGNGPQAAFVDARGGCAGPGNRGRSTGRTARTCVSRYRIFVVGVPTGRATAGRATASRAAASRAATDATAARTADAATAAAADTASAASTTRGT